MKPPYSTSDVAKLTGFSYRQIDYLERTGFVRASIAEAQGPGSQRRWSDDDVDKLRLAKRLLDAGVSWTRLRRDGDPAVTAVAILAELRSLAPAEAVA